MSVYFNDPDANSNGTYFEDIEAFRRRPEEGEYHRKFGELGPAAMLIVLQVIEMLRIGLNVWK